MIDATMPLERQDLTIARLVAQEGRALVVVLNKWDLIEDPNAAMAEIRHTLTSQLADVRGVPCVPLSALTGRNVEKLLPAVVAALQPLGQPGLDRRAQSLAGRGAGAASAAAGPGPPGQDPLRHPDRPPARRPSSCSPTSRPTRCRTATCAIWRRACATPSTWTGCRSASTSGTARTLTTRTDRAGRVSPLPRAFGQQQLDHRTARRQPAAASCRAARRDRPCARSRVAIGPGSSRLTRTLVRRSSAA